MIGNKPGLTDQEIDDIRENMPKSLIDCLNDPYDCDDSGDPFSSAVHDLREFARLIDVAAVQKAKNNVLRDRAMLEMLAREMVPRLQSSKLTLDVYLRTFPVSPTDPVYPPDLVTLIRNLLKVIELYVPSEKHMAEFEPDDRKFIDDTVDAARTLLHPSNQRC